MFMVLFWIALNLLTCFLYLYCRDEPRFKHGHMLYDLRMPSVRDLDRSCDRSTVSDYVEEVIRPANDFFNLRAELKYDNEIDLIHKFSIQMCSFIHIPMSLSNWLKSFAFFQEHQFMISVVVSATILLCIFLCLAITGLYEYKPAIHQYTYGQKELKELFMSSSKRTEFPVKEDIAFRNFVILSYYSYLIDIRKSIKRRRSLLICMSTLAIAALIVTIIHATKAGC